MNIENEIRAIAFLKIEEILEREYERMNGQKTAKDACIVQELEDLVEYLKNCHSKRPQMLDVQIDNYL